MSKERTLEEKLVDALKAADAAFEAGYPVKAHRIVQGALKLCVTQPPQPKETPAAKPGAPTPRAEWVRDGDTCVAGVVAGTPNQMFGKVLWVDHKLSIPQARVLWDSGSTGTHTISTLRRAERPGKPPIYESAMNH